MSFPFITDNGEFRAFCLEAEKQPAIGVDTEFVWNTTYYPYLGLVQMGWDQEHCILADPTTITDTTPFRHLMENAQVTKVFHEAGSDLPILYRWCPMAPRALFDTRISGGFAGLTGRLSLAKLLSIQLGVVIPKTETRTDWMQRPLTAAQLQYAGQDVVYLPALAQSLTELMKSCGNLERFQEEMRHYEQPEFFQELPLEDCWKAASLPGYLKLNRQDMAVFQKLVAWRDGVARANNITKNRVMKDDWLAQAAVKHPYTVDEVLKIQGIWTKQALRYGEEVARIVTEAMKLPKEAWPDPPRLSVDLKLAKRASERLGSLIEKRALAFGMESAFVGSRRDIEALVLPLLAKQDISQAKLMTGWRYQLLAPAIDEIISDFRGRKK